MRNIDYIGFGEIDIRMNPLIQHLLDSFPNLSKTAQTQITQNFVLVHKPKGEMLLQQGQIAKKLFFVRKGICRYFSNQDGEEITNWFGFENEFVTSFSSFFPKKPSYESIITLTDCELYQIDYVTFQSVLHTSIELERVNTFFITMYTVQLEERLYIIQTKTAAEKYQHLLEHQPHFIQQIPNKYLASYLGITRETLSRIRAKVR